jgi:hypothetical protein
MTVFRENPIQEENAYRQALLVCQQPDTVRQRESITISEVISLSKRVGSAA